VPGGIDVTPSAACASEPDDDGKTETLIEVPELQLPDEPEQVEPPAHESPLPVHIVPTPLHWLDGPEHVDPPVHESLPPVHMVPEPLQLLDEPEHVEPPAHESPLPLQVCPLIVHELMPDTGTVSACRVDESAYPSSSRIPPVGTGP
jgi:hypothetical protein